MRPKNEIRIKSNECRYFGPNCFGEKRPLSRYLVGATTTVIKTLFILPLVKITLVITIKMTLVIMGYN